MTALIAGLQYRVEFSYRTKRGTGKHRPDRIIIDPMNINGISVCTIVAPGFLICNGVAICSAEDHFNRRIGRYLAFSQAVGQCSALRSNTPEWHEWFQRVFPAKPQPPTKPNALSPEEKERRKNSGHAQDVRATRTMIREIREARERRLTGEVEEVRTEVFHRPVPRILG